MLYLQVIQERKLSTFLVVVLKIDRNVYSYTVELSYSIIKGTE